MKQNILSKLLLLLFLVLSPSLHAYNYSWSTHEDITNTPPPPEDPGECDSEKGCEGPSCKADRDSSPVYSKSGHFVWDETDAVLPGKPSLSVYRGYTSQEPRIGMFGKGWVSRFEESAVHYTVVEGGGVRNRIVFRLSNGLRFMAIGSGVLTEGPIAGQIDVTEGYGHMNMPRGNKGFLIDDLVFANGDYYTLQEDITLHLPNGAIKVFSKTTGKLLQYVDSNGNALVYTYDNNGRLSELSNGAHTLLFAYNANGFVSQISDESNRAWQYLYDIEGNLIEKIDPLGNSRTYTYENYSPANDAQVYSHLTAVTDAEGTPVVHVVYTASRVQSYTEGENTYTYTYGNHLTQKRDSMGSTYVVTWADAGFITKRTDPLGNSTLYLYDSNLTKVGMTDKRGYTMRGDKDALGRVLRRIDPLGNITTYTYDGNNTRPSTITTPLGHTTSITYDAKQNPLTITDAKGNTQSFKYDSKGNAIEITDAKGAKTTIVYNANNQPTSITNALGYTTTIAYDALGRQQSITDAEGRTTTYEYDAMDRIVKTTDAIGNVVAYTYDKAGRLVSLKDPVGNTTTYTYDTYGRVATETRPDGGVTMYAYNTDNTIKTITRRDGKVVTYTYDAAKRPTSQSVDGDTISYTYDAEGNILTATNSSGTVSFAYDETGKLTKETQLGIDITTSYDAESNVKTLSFLNKTVNYSRDALGLATSIDTTAFTYDANSIQTQLDYANGTSEANTFDAVYNIKKIQTANETLNYTQDKTGLITSKNNTNYTYDNIGRLTGAGADSFNYDAAGNNLNDNAVYNILNNRLSASDIYTITYDSMGNIKSKYNKLTNTTSNYTFNSRNQLVSYEQLDDANQTTKTLSYTYDAFNRRVSKTEDGVEQKYLYDGDDIVAILDSSNAVIATITHDESIDTPLSITNANGTFYYHRDHQGSIIALTDSSGAVVESFTYDNHYGTIANHTKTTETNNPYGYTGRELDTNELYYYRARYYDPSLQRFLGEDPIGFDGGDFNWYRYVLGNPILFIDPLGLNDPRLNGRGVPRAMGGDGGISDSEAARNGNIAMGVASAGAFAGGAAAFGLGKTAEFVFVCIVNIYGVSDGVGNDDRARSGRGRGPVTKEQQERSRRTRGHYIRIRGVKIWIPW